MLSDLAIMDEELNHQDEKPICSVQTMNVLIKTKEDVEQRLKIRRRPNHHKSDIRQKPPNVHQRSVSTDPQLDELFCIESQLRVKNRGIKVLESSLNKQGDSCSSSYSSKLGSRQQIHGILKKQTLGSSVSSSQSRGSASSGKSSVIKLMEMKNTLFFFAI
ncbi:hypothetical protein pb186bvf_015495 [Paramecium bursaria]